MEKQDLYLTHLKLSTDRTTLFQLQKGEEAHWLKGLWVAREGHFRIIVAADDLPFQFTPEERFVAQVRVLDDTGVHSFEANLRSVSPEILELDSLGQITVEQRRIFIRLKVTARIQYRPLLQAENEPLWGIMRDISPNGLAFEAAAELADGEAVEIFFREEPWDALVEVVGRIAGRRQHEGEGHLYRLVFKDEAVAKTFMPLIAREYTQRARQQT